MAKVAKSYDIRTRCYGAKKRGGGIREIGTNEGVRGFVFAYLGLALKRPRSRAHQS